MPRKRKSMETKDDKIRPPNLNGGEKQEEEGNEKEEEEKEVNSSSDSDEDKDQDDVDKDDMEIEDTEAYSGKSISFFDSFYGLASSDPADRAESAYALLNHCLIGPDANEKDAAYALRRLMQGLCSGRAAARQGYASTLTSFLNISNQNGILKGLVAEDEQNDIDDKERFIPACIRSRLRKATDPNEISGKKKGSEERDHYFGRLFGIQSVIRSALLSPQHNEQHLDQLKLVVCGFAEDLVELYNHRKWLREPAALAIIHLFDFFFQICPSQPAKDILQHLISEIILGRLLSGIDVADYTAEKVAIGVYIQSQAHKYNIRLPEGMREAILSVKNIEKYAKALGSTSTVPQPRMHIVWDVLWSFCLTVPMKKRESNGEHSQPAIRVLQTSLQGTKDSIQDIIQALMEQVVRKSLLGMDVESCDSPGVNATHERRALAMTVVKVLCGSMINSPELGRYRLLLEGNVLQNNVLTNDIIRKLFIDVICAGVGKQASHILKPMALNALNAIAEQSDISPKDLDRRISCVKAFLTCEPRFDSRTKSGACTKLLLLDEGMILDTSAEIIKMWKEYVTFLQARVLALCQNADSSKSYDAIGYIDLLYLGAKKIFRWNTSESKDETSPGLIGQILDFFFVGAFFDCSSLKKVKSSDPILSIAKKVQKFNATSGNHDVRTAMSARFFSLLADLAGAPILVKADSKVSRGSKSKDARLFQVMKDFHEKWKQLESKGCKPFGSSASNRTESDNVSEKAIREILGKQTDIAKNEDLSDESWLHRFMMSCATLGIILDFHRLTCGEPEALNDDDGSKDIDEKEETDQSIKEFISNLASVQNDLISQLGLNVHDNEIKSQNHLVNLAEICLAILSSSFGSEIQARGASPKLLKETVKSTWVSALALCGQHTPDPSPFDDNLLRVLLSSIGVTDMEDEDEEASDTEEDDDDNMEDELCGNDDPLPSSSNNVAVEIDEEPSDEEDELILDSNGLQNFLLQSSDEDEPELEHHAGADKALAMLIKLKQDAKKAGQQAMEREALTNQVRCSILLENLFSNSGRQYESLMTPSFVKGAIVKMLALRSQLESSLVPGTRTGKKPSLSDGEKRTLIEKVSTFLKSRLFKAKSFPEMTHIEYQEFLDAVTTETKKAKSDNQLGCCSSALLVLYKIAVKNEDRLTSLSSAYSELVNEWATKRTTRLKATVFNDVILYHPR
jgi:DNA polymerase phi